MATLDNSTKTLIGKYGESLLYSELLRNGYNSFILGNQNIYTLPDIVATGNIGIEVKTSVYHSKAKQSTYDKNIFSSGWQFGQLQRSSADFYIFVLLKEDLSLYKFLTFNRSDIPKQQNFFYLKPAKGDYKRKRGRVRQETLLDPQHEGLSILFHAIDNSLNNLKK